MQEKVKVELSTSSILKKKLTKIILKKNMWRNTVAKQKPFEKTLQQFTVFKEKNYEAKSTKTILQKKKKKIHKF